MPRVHRVLPEAALGWPAWTSSAGGRTSSPSSRRSASAWSRRTTTRPAATTTCATSAEVLEHLDELVRRRPPRARRGACWRRGSTTRCTTAVGDNEERSARLADAALTQAGVPIPPGRRGDPPGAADRGPRPGGRRPARAAPLATPTWRSWPRDPGATTRTSPACGRSTPHVPDADFRAGRARRCCEDLLAHARCSTPTRARERWEDEGPGQRQRGGGGAFLIRRPALTSRVTSSRLDTGVGAGRDHRVVPLGRDVVVVAVEAPLRDAERPRRTRAARRTTCRWPGATRAGRARRRSGGSMSSGHPGAAGPPARSERVVEQHPPRPDVAGVDVAPSRSRPGRTEAADLELPDARRAPATARARPAARRRPSAAARPRGRRRPRSVSSSCPAASPRGEPADSTASRPRQPREPPPGEVGLAATRRQPRWKRPRHLGERVRRGARRPRRRRSRSLVEEAEGEPSAPTAR